MMVIPYDIMLKDNYLYKEYKNNFNINVAISEFIRFFIYLDDYISINNIC